MSTGSVTSTVAGFTGKLTCMEKIGYGFGDAASHIVFDNVMLYMMFFYTDIVGLPAAFVGTMFLLSRCLDAVADPIMGHLADRTRTRWGQFRPFVLFGALCCYIQFLRLI